MILQRDTSNDRKVLKEKNDRFHSVLQKHRRAQWMDFAESNRLLTTGKLCNTIKRMNEKKTKRKNELTKFKGKEVKDPRKSPTVSTRSSQDFVTLKKAS